MTQFAGKKAEDLKAQVDAFQTNHWRLHRKAARLSIVFTVLGILLGAAVTAAGFFDQAKLAGVIGIVLTALISLQDTFNFSEKSAFHARIQAQGKALRDRLRYLVDDEAEFIKAFDSYEALRLTAAEQAPKGKGISVASRGGES